MCVITPREVIEKFVMEYRAEIAAEEEARKAEAAKTKPAGEPRKSSRRAGGGDNRVKRCAAFLKKIPPSIEGDHGSDRVFQAARIIWNDFDIDEADGYPLLQEYAATADPPWEEDGNQGLRRKWDEAVKKGPGPEGRGYRLKQDSPGWEPRGEPTFGSAMPSEPHETPETPTVPTDETEDSAADVRFPKPQDGEQWNDPHRLARLLVDASRTAEREPTLLGWRDEWHQWVEGAWRAVPDSDLDALVARHCRAVFVADLPGRKAAAEAATEGTKKEPKPPTIFPVTSKVKSDVKTNLSGLVNYPDVGANAPFWLWGDAPHDPAEVIAAPNGLFTLRDIAAGRGPFEAPTPRLFTQNALTFPVPVGEQGAPAVWMKCLDQWFNGDTKSILGLQEWAGYLLSAYTNAHKILLLVGPMRSGKGTFLRTLSDLVGDASIVSTTFSRLGESFGLAPLLGKRVATIPDARLVGRTDLTSVVERLLSISGDDQQSINRKNKSLVSAFLRVRFVIATNELPALPEASGALASRFHILNLPNSFLGKEDELLQQKLRAELPAILAWAAKGFVRLQSQRMKFTQNDAAAELHREMEDLSSPVRAFVRERCSIGPTCQVKVKQLCAEWQGWNLSRNKKPTDDSVFGRDLRAAFPHIKRSQPRENGQKVRYYMGIGLRDRAQWGDPDETVEHAGTCSTAAPVWDEEGSSSAA